MSTAIRTALSSLTLSSIGSAAAPEWIEVLPAGAIVTRDGRKFHNDNPEIILAAFAADRKDIAVDYEHASEVRAAQGLSAPAVGWISELRIVDGAIQGRVSWTDEGKAAVESRAYRYVSPVVHLDKQQRALRISSVALTNEPAIFFKSLNRRAEAPADEDASMLKAIAVKLGLAEAATETEILAAINTRATETETLRSAAPDPTKFVARADYDTLVQTCSTLRTEVQALKDAETTKVVVAAVDEAIATGKVPPSVRETELALCKAVGVEAYKERLSKLSAIVKPGETTTAADPSKPAGALDDAQKEMCRRLGIAEADYAKALNPAA